MINSISLEQKKMDAIIPIIKEKGCEVIALAMDEKGIPQDPEKRLEIIEDIVSISEREGIAREKLYIDPLIMAVSTNTESGNIALRTMKYIVARFPGIHFTAGLSNVSFGLPNRSIINQAFITLAIDAGLDTVIMNPLDRGVRAAILAAELVLGRDRHCQNYTRASKRNVIGV
jgi:5-methyltetrahydrofolate--homocysteine methyltransferase